MPTFGIVASDETETETDAVQAPPLTSRSPAWRPWLWRPMNQATALCNAREASVELSRRRVEREAVDIFIAELGTDAEHVVTSVPD